MLLTHVFLHYYAYIRHTLAWNLEKNEKLTQYCPYLILLTGKRTFQIQQMMMNLYKAFLLNILNLNSKDVQENLSTKKPLHPTMAKFINFDRVRLSGPGQMEIEPQYFESIQIKDILLDAIVLMKYLLKVNKRPINIFIKCRNREESEQRANSLRKRP